MANQGWNTVGTEENKGNNGGGQSQEDKLDFLATPEGDTKIRVLDEAPYFYQEFWSVKGNEGKGTSIPYKGKGKDLLEKANFDFMDTVFKEADDKGLKKGSEARKKHTKAGYDKQPFGKLKSKYLIHVLDRADGQIKLLDKGKGVFEALKKYAMNPEYGDLRNYDVTITRTGTGWMDTEYSVTPARSNTPLTDEEVALYEAKKVDLHKLKGGEDLTPEQCLFVANGGAWSEVNNVGQADNSVQEMAEENYQANLQPSSLGADKGITAETSIPLEDGSTITVTSKEGALSDEELERVLKEGF